MVAAPPPSVLYAIHVDGVEHRQWQHWLQANTATAQLARWLPNLVAAVPTSTTLAVVTASVCALHHPCGWCRTQGVATLAESQHCHYACPCCSNGAAELTSVRQLSLHTSRYTHTNGASTSAMPSTWMASHTPVALFRFRSRPNLKLKPKLKPELEFWLD